MKLTDKQIRAITLFLNHSGNIKRTCESLGIKRMIFYRWLKIPEFKKAIDWQIDILHDNMLTICFPLLNDIQVRKVKTYYRKGKPINTITTVTIKQHPARIVLKAICTIFEVFARRGCESAMVWCGGIEKFKSISEGVKCNVYQLPSAIRQYAKVYRIAA